MASAAEPTYGTPLYSFSVICICNRSISGIWGGSDVEVICYLYGGPIMVTHQKPEDFRIEDWAIPEDELPWNVPTAATADKPTRTRPSANIIELDQYRRLKRDNQAAD